MNTTPTTLDFVSLQVQNLEASKDFYTNTLGFEVGRSPNPDAIVFQDAAGAIFAIRKPLLDLTTVPRLGVGIGLWFAVAYFHEIGTQFSPKSAPSCSYLRQGANPSV